MAERFLQIAVAVGLGLLVGLQRERAKSSSFGGIRTFPLLTVAGVLAGQIAVAAGSAWMVAAGALALVALIVTSNLALQQEGEPKAGMTTEVAALVLYLTGASLAYGNFEVAVVCGGLVAVLLQLKGPMHELAERLTERDLRAVMQIALLALVILPVLPDRTYGPYDVLNPFRIWLVVVLITGISMASYVIHRLLGARAGLLLGSVLGGFISSTATTASYSRRARKRPSLARAGSVALMIASTVVFFRILVEVGALASDVLPRLAPPLLAVTMANVGICALGFLLFRPEPIELAEPESPTELRAALVFGALYGVVLLAVAAAREHFGQAGLYTVAAISGLTDVDAITISTAKLVSSGRIEDGAGWRTILIAALSNLVFKAGLAAALGGAALFARVAVLFGASLAAGLAVLALWPG